VTPGELRLQELVEARDACVERRMAATRGRAMRLRVHAIDSELADLIEAIQRHCAATGLPLPAGIPPLSKPRAHALVIAQSILDRYLRLLDRRYTLREVASRAGDHARVREIELAISTDRATIRKHCERAGLPTPPALTADEDES